MNPDQSLAGKRILITRARRQAGQLSAELEKLGAEAIEIPAIEIQPPTSYDPLDNALQNLRQYQWLIITSANTVRAIHDRSAILNLKPADFAHLKIAAIGSATAQSLKEAGLSVAIQPKEYVAESLLESLAGKTKNANVLIARATIARDLIPQTLSASGANVHVVEAYRTVIPPGSLAAMAALFKGKPPHAATFTSSSTVTNFFHLLQAAGQNHLPQEAKAISIGPITSQTLRDHNWEPSAEADPHDIGGLIAAVLKVLR